MLGGDRYPAEVAGWGPIHAELARDLAAGLGRAEWRFAITDTDGQLLDCGITRAQPAGFAGRAANCRGVVELQISEDDLIALDEVAGAWAGVLADIARQHHSDRAPNGNNPARRAPGAVLRRWLEIRDRYCTMPGCRAQTGGADADHTRDHAHGGPTTGPNLGMACRHDHMLKTKGGWRLDQPESGVFRWASRTGHVYVRPPPPILEPLPDPIPSGLPLYPVWTLTDDDWESDQERHEAPCNRVEVKDLHRDAVAAA